MLVKFEDTLKDLSEVNHLLTQGSISMDIIVTMFGKKLGQGSYRATYDFNLNPDFVIKVEHENTHCNVNEWMLWNQIQHFSGDLAWVKDWFAPVEWISPNGRLMKMKKTVQKPDKKLPDKVPAFFWDVKYDNFGWIGNKFVCHDYGHLYNFLSFKNKFVTAKWNK